MSQPQGILTRRAALGAMSGILALPLTKMASAGFPAGKTVQSDESATAGTTMLFFDDEPLYARTGLVRRLGRPRRLGAYHEAAGNCTWGRPCVFRVEGGWRVVYQAGVIRPNSGGGVILIAESEDGINWRPLDTTELLSIASRRTPHQLLPETAGNFGCVVEDRHAPAATRYKLLTTRDRVATALWTSPDLLRWRCEEGVQWHPDPPDPPVLGFWSAVRRCHVLTTRPEWLDRRVCLIETSDWRHFTEPRLALHADGEDEPLAQHYGLCVLPYEGYYVGILWLYHAGEAETGDAPRRFRGGRVEGQLVYSLNGSNWQRCLHAPLFANGAPGDPDAGCLQIASSATLPDGTLRFYGACSRNQHGICPRDDGYLVSYELRRDGFVCLQAGAEPGRLSTRALHWRGGELQLNVDALGGSARVQVIGARGENLVGYSFEDCVPMSGDSTAWTPLWGAGRTMAGLAGRMVRVEIELRSASLFALRGDYLPTGVRGLRRWESEGVPPSRRTGL
jgi:hypothetical protein